MRGVFTKLCIVVLTATLVACSSSRRGEERGGPGGGGGSGDGDGPPPGSPVDAGDGYGDDDPLDECGMGCGPDELCGMGDGNGSDDDCDGMVDEGCACGAVGITRGCFLGPPDRRGVGACADGVMTCTEFLTWGDCVRGQWPEDEVCDGADNDCNGVPDDELPGCETSVTCPGVQSAAPLNDHALRGSEIYDGDARSWRWTIECPPTVDTCPAPEDPSAADTSVYFVQSGSYRASLEVETPSGETVGCEWVIVVEGAGLRVELDWDTKGVGNGDTDVDLHLHRKSIPEGESEGETDFFTEDDCYYANCKASSYSDAVRARWGMADTDDLSACSDAPHGEGAEWESRGACYNPRLDVDVINCDPSVTDPDDLNFCAPENINVDNPPVGVPFRIMVNYFSAHGYTGPTHPSVNIYCGGELRGNFGLDPLVTLENGDGIGAANDNWMVADVVFFRDTCGELQCLVNPIGSIIRGADFGPPWSY